MRRAVRSGVERGIAAAVGLVAIGFALHSAYDLTRQAKLFDARARLDAQSRALARGDARIDSGADALRRGAPPAAQLTYAMIDLRAAEVSADEAERTRLLDRAGRSLEVAQAGRANWGEAEMVAAYLAALRTGDTADPHVLEALSASYRDAAMLREGGAWRVGVGLDHYDRLARETQRRVIEEATWLARTGNAARTAIFDRAVGSAGYRDLLLRWHDTRLTDADRVQRIGP